MGSLNDFKIKNGQFTLDNYNAYSGALGILSDAGNAYKDASSSNADQAVGLIINPLQQNANSYETLMSLWANNRMARTDYTKSDFLGLSNGSRLANGLLSSASTGLKAATLTGNPLIGLGTGLVNGVSGLIGGIKANRRARRAADNVNRLNNISNQITTLNFVNNADRLNDLYTRGIMAGYMQNGGPLSFGFGGNLGTNGSDFTDGLTYFDNGGRHEENPNQGIPLGLAPDGLPNLVEEGEVKWNKQDYIFSDRLKASMEFLEKWKLPKTWEDKTYAYIVKNAPVIKEAEERPNDPKSLEVMDIFLQELSEDQEAQKKEKEAEEIKEQLSEMSPEELAALGQQLLLEEALLDLAQLAQQPDTLGEQPDDYDQLALDATAKNILSLETVDQMADLEGLLQPIMGAEGGHLHAEGGNLANIALELGMEDPTPQINPMNNQVVSQEKPVQQSIQLESPLEESFTLEAPQPMENTAPKAEEMSTKELNQAIEDIIQYAKLTKDKQLLREAKYIKRKGSREEKEEFVDDALEEIREDQLSQLEPPQNTLEEIPLELPSLEVMPSLEIPQEMPLEQAPILEPSLGIDPSAQQFAEGGYLGHKFDLGGEALQAAERKGLDLNAIMSFINKLLPYLGLLQGKHIDWEDFFDRWPAVSDYERIGKSPSLYLDEFIINPEVSSGEQEKWVLPEIEVVANQEHSDYDPIRDRQLSALRLDYIESLENKAEKASHRVERAQQRADRNKKNKEAREIVKEAKLQLKEAEEKKNKAIKAEKVIKRYYKQQGYNFNNMSEEARNRYEEDVKKAVEDKITSINELLNSPRFKNTSEEGYNIQKVLRGKMSSQQYTEAFNDWALTEQYSRIKGALVLNIKDGKALLDESLNPDFTRTSFKATDDNGTYSYSWEGNTTPLSIKDLDNEVLRNQGIYEYDSLTIGNDNAAITQFGDNTTLKDYYQKKVEDFFKKHDYKGPLSNRSFNGKDLKEFINGLANSENLKDKELARILRANIAGDINNIADDASKIAESDGYKNASQRYYKNQSLADADEWGKNNAQANGQTDGLWGLQHYPYLEALNPTTTYTGKRVYYTDKDGNPVYILKPDNFDFTDKTPTKQDLVGDILTLDYDISSLYNRNILDLGNGKMIVLPEDYDTSEFNPIESKYDDSEFDGLSGKSNWFSLKPKVDPEDASTGRYTDFLRYAPLLNRPFLNSTNSLESLLRAADGLQYIGAPRHGEYLKYQPVDTLYRQHLIMADNNAARNGIIGSANNNIGLLMANLALLNSKALNAIGENLLNSESENWQRKALTIELHNSVDLPYDQLAVLADQANMSNNNLIVDNKLKAAQLAYEIENGNNTSRSQALADRLGILHNIETEDRQWADYMEHLNRMGKADGGNIRILRKQYKRFI